MKTVLEKWQATVIVLAIVASITTMVILEKVDASDVVTGLLQLGSAVLAAGAVAHGVVQGAKANSEGVTKGSQATADPPPEV